MNLEEAASLLPKRDPNSHKGQNGRVVVVGGCRGYYGAPIIAGLAAEKSGVDAVTLFLPPSHVEAAKGYSLNFFIKPMMFDEIGLYDVKAIHDAVDAADVLLIGNGLGVGFDVKKTVLSILCGIEKRKPVVIDAQAILPEILEIYKPNEHNWIITPHKTEMMRLSGMPGIIDELIEWALSKKLVICLKGKVDHIIDGRNGVTYDNETGTPYMSVGGTGDALAGIISAYISTGMDMVTAARLATFLWGLCGQRIDGAVITYDMLNIWPDLVKELYRHHLST